MSRVTQVLTVTGRPAWQAQPALMSTASWSLYRWGTGGWDTVYGDAIHNRWAEKSR